MQQGTENDTRGPKQQLLKTELSLKQMNLNTALDEALRSHNTVLGKYSIMNKSFDKSPAQNCGVTNYYVGNKKDAHDAENSLL